MCNDSFINGNVANVRMDDARYGELQAQYGDDAMFDAVPGIFLEENNVQHDEEDDDAFPVLAWKLNGEYVAWWDCANLHGYAAAA